MNEYKIVNVQELSALDLEILADRVAQKLGERLDDMLESLEENSLALDTICPIEDI